MQIILDFLKDFIQIMLDMSPYLLLGFLIAGLLYAFVPNKKINKYLNGNPLASSIRAAIFGVPLPLCSCGVIPTGTSLYKNGASKGSTVSFLISTPQTGVDSILATFSLMGLPMAIIRPITAFITGITGGYITSKLTSKKEAQEKSQNNEANKKVNGQAKSSCCLNEEEVDNNENKTFLQKLGIAFKYGFINFLGDIAKWLTIGLILAGIISAVIPDNFSALLNMPPILQMLLVLIVSIPLYICATGSIPLAAILILKGLSPGAAFILLMAGPATNAATITMIKKVMGTKTVIIYLSTIISGALLSGLLIDYALPSSWFNIVASSTLNHSMDSLVWWKIASAIILFGLLAYSLVKGLISSRKYKNSKSQISNKIDNLNINNMETKEFKVNGMVCGHCKANVESNLKMLPFIKNISVNLNSKRVTVSGDNIDLDKIKETINDIGYEYSEK